MIRSDDGTTEGRNEGESVSRLLDAIRAVARDEQAAAARCPEQLAPVLDEKTRAHIADQIVRALFHAGSQTREFEAVATKNTAAVRAAGGLAAGALRRRAGKRRSRGLAFGGVVLAAAAVILFWIRPGSWPTSEDAVGLPEYTMEITGGTSEFRGRGDGRSGDNARSGANASDRPAPVPLRSDSELRMHLRPDVAVAGPIAVRAFFVRGETVDELKPAVQVAETGAVELRVRGTDLRGSAHAAANSVTGIGTLKVFIGRPSDMRAIDKSEVGPEHGGRLRAVASGRLRPMSVSVDLGAD